jgi:hypothetical protein
MRNSLKTGGSNFYIVQPQTRLFGTSYGVIKIGLVIELLIALSQRFPGAPIPSVDDRQGVDYDLEFYKLSFIRATALEDAFVTGLAVQLPTWHYLTAAVLAARSGPVFWTMVFPHRAARDDNQSWGVAQIIAYIDKVEWTKKNKKKKKKKRKGVLREKASSRESRES